VTYCASSVCFD